MATPAFVAAGTPQGVAASTAITVPWPASHLVGDVALLCVERAGGSASPALTTAAGFVAVPGGEQSTGTGTNGTKISVFWCRATSTTMASPVVDADTNHQYGAILTFRNCVATGDPWNVVGGGTKPGSSTSLSATGVTTTVAGTLVVCVCARDNDISTACFSNQANASLSGLAEHFDLGTTQGGGGGFGCWSGTLAAAGASGTTTATTSLGIHAWVTLALSDVAGPTGVGTQRWDGSAWQPATVKRWDGGAWVTATVKRWNGSAWV